MKRSNLSLALLLIIVDLSAIFLGFYLAYYIRADGGEYLYHWPLSTYLTYVFYSLPVFLIFLISQGLYNPKNLPSGWKALAKLFIGIISGWGVLLIGLYLWRSPEAQALPRLLILYAIGLVGLFTLTGRVMSSIVISTLYSMGYGVTRTVIITADNNHHFVSRLKSERSDGRNVVAVVKIDEFKQEIAKIKNQFDELIVASENLPENKVLELLSWAEDHYKQFAMIPSLLSVRATNIEVVTIASTPVTYFLRTPLEGWKRFLKRLIDIAISLVLIVILSPVFVIVYLLILYTSKGPAIFNQVRIGQDGKKFSIHKFRTMYHNANRSFPSYNSWSGDEQTDQRITPIGRFLRKTYLDEIPQLWDILVGKMSLVGPRPEQPDYVKNFSKEMPDYLKRHYVKTGLTGWAQINGLRGDTSIKERIKYDLYYIENWSVIFDLRIILATGLLFLKQLFNRQ